MARPIRAFLRPGACLHCRIRRGRAVPLPAREGPHRGFCALILSLAGADFAFIMEDYLKTNEALAPFFLGDFTAKSAGMDERQQAIMKSRLHRGAGIPRSLFQRNETPCPHGWRLRDQSGGDLHFDPRKAVGKTLLKTVMPQRTGDPGRFPLFWLYRVYKIPLHVFFT